MASLACIGPRTSRLQKLVSYRPTTVISNILEEAADLLPQIQQIRHRSLELSQIDYTDLTLRIVNDIRHIARVACSTRVRFAGHCYIYRDFP